MKQYPFKNLYRMACVSAILWGAVLSLGLLFLCAPANAEYGKDWVQVKADDDLPWTSRENLGVLSYSNKLWAFGGWDGAYNNDVYSSPDGVTWTEETNTAAWSARHHFASVVFDNRMWLIGGQDDIGYKNDVWWSVDGVNWTEATGNASWSIRTGHSVIVANGEMWLLGGFYFDGSNHYYNDVWRSSDGVTWTSVTNNAPWSARYDHTAEYFNEKFWVFGGNNGTYNNDIWYSSDGEVWTEASEPAAWGTRNAHNSFIHDSRIWIIGGANTGVRIGDAWYSNDGLEWTAAITNADWARSDFGSAVFNGAIFLVGGLGSSSRLSDVWKSSIGVGVDWHMLTNTPGWGARTIPAATIHDGKAWIAGGYDLNDTMYHDVWSSNDGQSWTQSTAAAEWSGRAGLQMVSYDGKLWILGGNWWNGSSWISMNDVWYSADGSTWTQATGGSPWQARRYHSCIVYDNKMWLMGGRVNVFAMVNDVWYSTDGANWTQATASAGWSPRCSFGASVFDGKMWVFGGEYESGGDHAYLNDIWSSTDGINWTQSTDAASWPARGGHAAVVRDDEIWLFGGTNNVSEFNDVWKSVDGTGWEKVSDAADWSGRTHFSAVTLDGKLLLFAGQQPSGSQFFGDVWCTPTVLITTQPRTQSVALGNSITFSVVAEGVLPFTYQWRKDGVDIPDATDATYSILSATELDEGSYDCVITNVAGTVTSDPAMLYVVEETTIMLPGDVPLELVKILAGNFMMGRYLNELSSNIYEDPQHAVTIEYDFYMGKYEITQAQWLALMGSWPGTAPSASYGVGDNYPAYYLSWDDIQNFITALNAHITNTSQGPVTMRLPSEAEWEYACRAGTTTRFYFGDSLECPSDCSDCAAGVLSGNRTDYMWYCGNNSPYGSKPVGGKYPNAFGLYDMSGNVFEWCEDDFHYSYSGAPDNGSAWLESPREADRVLRGGYWDYDSGLCRSASRGSRTSTFRYTDGFRVAAVNPCAPDLNSPVISLLGNATVSVECNTVYADAGATASDNCDGDLSAGIVAVNPINTAIPGTYTVTYNVMDAANNAATEVTRFVTVEDTTAPVITLLGDASLEIACGTMYVNAGATATDVCGGNLTTAIVTNNPVNVMVSGTYTVLYNVSDAASNAATEVTRTVTVQDNCPTLGEEMTILLPGDVPLELVRIPAGTFMMGALPR
jgi:formylglycine-generating enzyme required for sulfatase activity